MGATWTLELLPHVSEVIAAVSVRHPFCGPHGALGEPASRECLMREHDTICLADRLQDVCTLGVAFAD
jgi:hypothetical protein